MRKQRSAFLLQTLTFSFPQLQMSGGGHELDVTRDKEIFWYDMQVSFKICSFSELCCNPWDIRS